jgi:hypothetical protein
MWSGVVISHRQELASPLRMKDFVRKNKRARRERREQGEGVLCLCLTFDLTGTE